MLDLSAIDLGMLVVALEDQPLAGGWWIDASSGDVWYWGDGVDDDDFDPDQREDARPIDPVSSRSAYADMEDFIALVPDPRAADLLRRAIVGKGAFRRFKDTLFEFPDLPPQWFRFAEVRTERRAIRYLVDEGLVDEAEAERALAERGDPPVGVPSGSTDARVLAIVPEPVIHIERRAAASETCRAILAELPDWFGLDDSNEAYARAADEHPTFVAVDDDGSDVGIVTVVQHAEQAAEVHLLAVRRSRHRQGLGTALLEVAEAELRARGVRFLQVKTLSPAQPDEGYERTRRFYEARGFVTLEDFPHLWDADNPARQMIKTIDGAT